MERIWLSGQASLQSLGTGGTRGQAGDRRPGWESILQALRPPHSHTCDSTRVGTVETGRPVVGDESPAGLRLTKTIPGITAYFVTSRGGSFCRGLSRSYRSRR